MSDFINKVKKGSDEFDIQDSRIPQPEATDEGKVLGVVSGALSYVNAGGGGSGTKLYLHTLQLGEHYPEEILKWVDNDPTDFDNVADVVDNFNGDNISNGPLMPLWVDTGYTAKTGLVSMTIIHTFIDTSGSKLTLTSIRSEFNSDGTSTVSRTASDITNSPVFDHSVTAL